MEQTHTTSPPPRATKELIRPGEGRVIAGVAKGVADRLDLPLWVVRAGFVGLTLLGGFGLALYGAGWLLIPGEGETESVAARLLSDLTSTRAWVGIGLIALAAMVLVDNFTFLDGGVLIAVGLLVFGVLLYTGHVPGEGSTTSSPAPDSGPEPDEAHLMPDEARDEAEPGGGEPPPVPAAAGPPPPPPPPPRERSMLGRLTLGAALVAAGILAVLDNIATLPMDAGPRHYLALIVTVLGLGLILGAFIGRARWLILLGVLLIPTLLASPAFEYDWRSDEFDVRILPLGFDQLTETYAIEVGSLTIDLSQLPWNGETIRLNARADAGDITIFVPEAVGIRGQATADAGRVASEGRIAAGIGTPTLDFFEDGDLGSVLLDVSVDVGNIDIHRRP